MGHYRLGLILLLLTATVNAQAGNNEDRTWIYFGANLGYTAVKPVETLRESSRDGYAAHLKVLGSKYWEKWVADLGVGFQYHSASGTDRFSLQPDGTVKVRTRSAFIEFSPRYRLGPNWQFGGVVNGFFGTDVSFSESAATSNGSSFSFAAGGRFDYETPGEWHRWRFGGQIMHDITLSDRGIWWMMVDVQFGLPVIFGGDSAPAQEPTPQPTAEAPKRPAAPKFAAVTAEKGVKIYLGEAVLRFKTASSELRGSSKMILEKVAKYLKKSPKAWSKMRVEGHADKRGKHDYNVKLSRKRAERVKNELFALGVPKKKLSAEGYGPDRPIDPADDLEAYALNRRVELSLDGVTNPEVLVRDLNELE